MIKENIFKIKERIALVSSALNKDLSRIRIVAVSKGRSLEQIKEAIEGGITDIGENRVQEALTKYNQLFGIRDSVFGARCSVVGTCREPSTENREPIKWHMVGHLQTNKVKDAVKIFDLIQSVDSFHLALEIDAQAAKIHKVQDILIEVNVSGEQNKFGLKPDGVIEVVKEMAKLKNINIRGLMAVAPVADNPEKVRPYFRKLKELLDKINELRITSYGLRVLSMGMTDDFEAAIEEGATMLRLGRAVFGK